MILCYERQLSINANKIENENSNRFNEEVESQEQDSELEGEILKLIKQGGE